MISPPGHPVGAHAHGDIDDIWLAQRKTKSSRHHADHLIRFPIQMDRWAHYIAIAIERAAPNLVTQHDDIVRSGDVLARQGQSADHGGDRNQIRPLRSLVPSVRGKAHRYDSTRIFGSYVVLDECRSGKYTAGFQDLLQPP